MLTDLRKFLLRGNVIDLAVAIIIGIAFGLVITSLVNDVIMAIVGAIFGKPNFDDLTFDIGDGVVYYGRFLTAVVNFVIIGTVLFFVVRIAEQPLPGGRGVEADGGRPPHRDPRRAPARPRA